MASFTSRPENSAAARNREIEVQPSYGLTDDQVEGMLLESFDFAEEDFRQRQVIEARREADTIIAALDKSRKNDAWSKLRSDEREQIAKLESGLRAVKDSDDYQSIRKGIDVLNQATMRLAELMMDTSRRHRPQRQSDGRNKSRRRPNRGTSHGESRI